MPTVKSCAYLNYCLECDVTYTQTSTDILNNRTLVKTNVYLKCPYGLYVSSRPDSYIEINGNRKTYTAPAINTDNGGRFLLTTHQAYVTHTSNGTKSCNIKSYYPMKATISGVYVSSITVNTNVTLPTINRSAPTISNYKLTPQSTSISVNYSASAPYGVIQYSYKVDDGYYINATPPFTITGLNPSQTYSIRVRVRGGNGIYAYSTLSTTTLGSYIYVKVNGVYKLGTPYVKVGGTYRKSTQTYIRDGTWKGSVN